MIAVILTSFTTKGMEERLTASLITCYPGPEVYELVGHEAIRIVGIDHSGMAVDSVWNFGVFDFNSPNFIYRFCKGETDYMLWGCPYSWFIPQYIDRGSRVIEQRLNFTPEETQTLRRLLQINSLPQNRTYRYNYVRDNCSTRVADIVEAAVYPRQIIYPDSLTFGSFRQAMRYYHRNYPWYQFGIDLALGGGIDLPIDSHEEMFAPLLLMKKMEGARFDDGESVVAGEEVLNPGREQSVLGPTPIWLSPMAFSIIMLAVSLAVAFFEWRKKRIVRWWNSLFFIVLGLTGVVVWFLVFFSSHDSTSPNLLFLWANPLQLVLGIALWWRVTRPAAVAMSMVNVIIMIVLSVAWGLQEQSANPAIFPLWGATLILSLLYLVTPQSSKGTLRKKYNNCRPLKLNKKRSK